MKNADDKKPTEVRDIRAARAEATRVMAELSDPTPSNKVSTDYDPEAQPEDVALRFALDGSRVYAAVLAADKMKVNLDDARSAPAEKRADNPTPGLIDGEAPVPAPLNEAQETTIVVKGATTDVSFEKPADKKK